MDIKDNLVPILCIGSMLIGVLFSYIYPRGDRRREKATIVFIFGAAVLLGNWLMEEPDILNTLRQNIGWVLLGLVITFVKMLGR